MVHVPPRREGPRERGASPRQPAPRRGRRRVRGEGGGDRATADAEKLAKLAERVDAIVGQAYDRLPAPTTGPLTFEAFAKQWTSGELHKLHPDHVTLPMPTG
jgi:hypothetical protein